MGLTSLSGQLVEASIDMQSCVQAGGIVDVVRTRLSAAWGTIRFGAFTVSPSGSVSEVPILDPPAMFRVANLEAWLLQGGTPQVADAGAHLLHRRLATAERGFGGILVEAGPREADDLFLLDALARLATASLSALHQKRLSQLVLEALEESEEAISFYDKDEGIIFTNDAYHRVFPHYPDRSSLIGWRHLDLYRLDLEAGVIDDPLAREDPDAYLRQRAEKANALTHRQREVQSIAGRTYIYIRSRSRTGATLSRRIDVTDQALAEAKLRERERDLHELAYKDALTGRHNRAFLPESLRRVRERIARGALDGFSVFLIDLNDFKAVNDTHGHDVGDHVLRTVAERVADAAPPGSAIIRMGGDEFIVLTEGAAAEGDLAATAEGFLATVGRPIILHDLVLRIGCSIGVAQLRAPEIDDREILIEADLAMYEAKGRRPKRSGYALFRSHLKDVAALRQAVLSDVRSAVHGGAFELHYQPQFVTRDLRLSGFEALLRWRHPTRGLVSPAEFIPALEEADLIETVGAWVLETACREAMRWPEHLTVAVNVSPLQLRKPGFTATLAETLRRTRLPAHRLELEITESVFLADEADARSILEAWKAIGVRIALDDFGRGYSAFSHLGSLPIDTIKIDGSFIGAMAPDDPASPGLILLKSIIRLGRDLGMTVTAEGVERQDQFDRLAALDCPLVQGFLFGKPGPSADVWPLVEAAAETVRSDREALRTG